MSQEALAERLGLTFQQVQKYEKGSNRVSASKLFDAASALEVPVATFFDGLEEEGAGIRAAPSNDLVLALGGRDEVAEAALQLSRLAGPERGLAIKVIAALSSKNSGASVPTELDGAE